MHPLPYFHVNLFGRSGSKTTGIKLILLVDELVFKRLVQPVQSLIFEIILLKYYLYLTCISCQRKMSQTITWFDWKVGIQKQYSVGNCKCKNWPAQIWIETRRLFQLQKMAFFVCALVPCACKGAENMTSGPETKFYLPFRKFNRVIILLTRRL